MGHTHCLSPTPETHTRHTEDKSRPIPETPTRQMNKPNTGPVTTSHMIVPGLLLEKSISPARTKEPGLEPGQGEITVNPVQVNSAMAHLQQSGWYWGCITASQAKQVLSGALEGTFLLRDSSSPTYWLTLSVKTSLGPTHLRIQHSGGLFAFDSLDAARPRLQRFAGAVELVQHYALACRRLAAGLQSNGEKADEEVKEEGEEKEHSSPDSSTPQEGSLPLRLSRPLYRAAPSLQHLCRIAINQHSRCHQDLPLPPRLKDYLQGYPFVL